MNTELFCRDHDRRDVIRRGKKWNGIDYVDVGQDQTRLCVHFINGIPQGLTERNFVIRGGTRITGIRVTGVVPPPPQSTGDGCLEVRVDRFGDFSTYTLCIVATDEDGMQLDRPPEGFDPFYSCVEFSFKANCPSSIDCIGGAGCAKPMRPEPEIDYLAKDYTSFRQLILDRLSLIMPDWRERHIPDIGIAIVEVLAYVGDYLSAYQDAVATEAYLDTARLRISVRRHARLVDYLMHEGCNARAWVFVETSEDVTLDAARTSFTTNWDDVADQSAPYPIEALIGIPSDRYVYFEPMHPTPQIELHSAHNEIAFYTWGNEECCIEKGATSATLVDAWTEGEAPDEENGGCKKHKHEHCGCHQPPKPKPPRPRKLQLKPGDFLLFEELLCATTGVAAGADRTHRHVVRLTNVTQDVDPVMNQPIVHIEWCREDALPFTMCMSAIGPAPDCELIRGISVARGNLVLVDHGRTQAEEDLGIVPAESTELKCDGVGDLEERALRAARFGPILGRGPVTFRQHLDAKACATTIVAQEARRATPQVKLRAIPPAPRDAVFQEDDLANPQALAARVRNGTDRAARTLRRHLSAETLDLLDSWDGTSTMPALAVEEFIQDLRRLMVEGLQPEPLFDADDIGDPTGLAFRLKDAIDAGAKTLRARLSEAEIALLEKLHDKLPDELRDALNRVIGSFFEQWLAQADLLASNGDDAHFVVEIDDDARAHLRFGDDDTGREPEPGTGFLATYRIGNGIAGNVGAEAITRMLLDGVKLSGITIRVRNPLAARGGTAPESVADVRALAPAAFRSRRQRAIIADDYAELAGLDSSGRREVAIQKAAAQLAWSGSWPVASVSIDARVIPSVSEGPGREVQQARASCPTRPGPSLTLGMTEVRPTLNDRVTALLHTYRRMGHDLSVRDAQYIPIKLVVDVCALPHHARGDVEREVRNALYAFFHPDNLTFGDDIHISRIIAAAQSIEGVATATVRVLRRMDVAKNPDFADGLLRLGDLEIARLDHDPNQPENGLLEIHVGGGR